MLVADKHIRLQSLDIFRGMIVCLMIIVGASGNYDYTFRMLDHAPWSGFTPTDFIFPSFLFIIGVAQSLSFKAGAGGAVTPGESATPGGSVTHGESVTPGESMTPGGLVADTGGRLTSARLGKILRRTVILFLLGLLINWWPFCLRDAAGHIQWIPVDQVRILGVLQRIALAYGISSLVELYLSERRLVLLCVLALAAYVCILNIGGYLDPYGVQTNIVGQIDRYLLGVNHIYREQGMPFDPEGLLSTLPAIVNVIGGYLTGRLLRGGIREPGSGQVLSGLLKGMMAGCVILVLGYLWSYFDPVNKKLWTSSFVLITVGMDIMLFSTIVYWADVRGRGFGFASFFTCFGKNPILIYLFSELLMKLLLFPPAASGQSLYALLYTKVFSSVGAYPGALLQAITYMLLCWTLAWGLNKKKLYLKI